MTIPVIVKPLLMIPFRCRRDHTKKIVHDPREFNVRRRVIEVLLTVAVMTFAAGFSAVASQEEAAPTLRTGGETTPTINATAPPPEWLERDTLTGDWIGGRPWLKERGITLKPRLTLFYQGMTSGDGDHDFESGGKADLLLDANLSKLGLWKGLSLSVHAEYNFGKSVNQRGGTIMPVNTALMFPGMKGAEAFDFSNVVLKQTFGDSVSLMAGKISIIDYCDSKPFMGGQGIDSFWNIVFAAPPSGTVPAYFLGSILSVRTEAATYGLWVYDPNSSVNKSGLEDAFADGVTIRGSVSFPVTIAGNRWHQERSLLFRLYVRPVSLSIEREPQGRPWAVWTVRDLGRQSQ
jgi:hypothetical protein